MIPGKRCPICEYANRSGDYERERVRVFTIIDTSEFTDKNGKLRKNTKKLLAVKKGTDEILKLRWQDQREEGKNFFGLMMRVRRSKADKAPAVGDDWTALKHVDLEGFPDVTEFDIAETLKPDEDKARTLLEKAIGSMGFDDPEEKPRPPVGKSSNPDEEVERGDSPFGGDTGTSTEIKY
jgi:hypothetical protein